MDYKVIYSKPNEPIYRFRIGDYRAIFRIDSEINALVLLVVIKIAHFPNLSRYLTGVVSVTHFGLDIFAS